MRKRLFWRLGILILLVAVAGVFLLIPQDTDTESDPVLRDTTKKLLEDGQKQQVPLQKADKPPSLGPSPNGHWDGDQWHEEPHTASPDVTTTSKIQPELSETEIKARVKALRAQQLSEYRAKWGENPSTDGSYQHFRDNHGNVVRHYRGTIVVSNYNLKVGFAPTPAELQKYKQLRAALKDAALKEDIEALQRLNDEIQSLVDSAQGEIPDPVGFGYYGDPISGEQEKILHNEALRSFYQRMGVEHLYELYGERSY